MPDCTDQTSVEDMMGLLRQGPTPWPDGWAGWKNCQLAHIRLLEETIATCPPYPDGRFAGRGIVISVNAKPGWSSGKHLPQGYFPGAWVVAKELRRLGCLLPITFAYMGELELDPNLERLAASELGVTCIDLFRRLKDEPMRILAGWESKVYSIIQAPYEQVLYMDADCFPVRDPSYLFDGPQFSHFGAVFWPDLPPHDRSEWLPGIVWLNVGLDPRPQYVDFESGQIMIDKRKCWRELIATRHINEHSDWYYKFVFGDKSTFHLAWAKCQDQRINGGWAMPSHACGWNGRHIEQFDFGSRLLFQHATQDKPSLSGFAAPQHLIHRDHCEQHLSDLREKWDGTLWINRAPTGAEREHMRWLMDAIWEYERIGLGSRDVRFLDDSRIGRGLAKCEVSWSCWETEEGPKLIVMDIDGKPTFRAIRQGAEWRGEWFEHERCPVVLRRKTHAAA